MTTLTLAHANTIVEAALAAGKAHGMMPLTVAVLDAGGHLIALQRQDGSGIMRVEIARGKAWASLGMGVPSRLLRDRLSPERQYFITGLVGASDGKFICVPGGVLIEGVLSSSPSAAFTVELFASATADPSGFGEGERFPPIDDDVVPLVDVERPNDHIL